MKSIILLSLIFSFAQAQENINNWKCSATCFKKSAIDKDFTRFIIRSTGMDLDQSFEILKKKCFQEKGKTSFLRDYIYRGGIPVVNATRNDFYTSSNPKTQPEKNVYCKQVSTLK